MNKEVAQPGTVFWGSLRNKDLLHGVYEEYRRLRPHMCPDPFKYWNKPESYWDSGECDEMITFYFDRLNDIAPEGYYFGAHPGDGADFGWWPNEEDSSCE